MNDSQLLSPFRWFCFWFLSLRRKCFPSYSTKAAIIVKSSILNNTVCAVSHLFSYWSSFYISNNFLRVSSYLTSSVATVAVNIPRLIPDVGIQWDCHNRYLIIVAGNFIAAVKHKPSQFNGIFVHTTINNQQTSPREIFKENHGKQFRNSIIISRFSIFPVIFYESTSVIWGWWPAG